MKDFDKKPIVQLLKVIQYNCTVCVNNVSNTNNIHCSFMKLYNGIHDFKVFIWPSNYKNKNTAGITIVGSTKKMAGQRQ